MTRTARFVLAQQPAGFRERQLLRIVAGEAKSVARRKFRYGARERILNNCAAALALCHALDWLLGPVDAGVRRHAFGQRLEPFSCPHSIDVPLREDGPKPGGQAAASMKVTEE